MKELKRIATSIERELDEKDKVREFALKESRLLIRTTKDLIGALGRKRATGQILKKMLKDAAVLKRKLAKHPDILHSGYVEAAQAEVVEASVLHSIIERRRMPSPHDLNVTAEAYLLGLGDVVGELRRFALESLREQRIPDANVRLSEMESIYEVLLRFDYPTAMVPLRKKRDVARGLVERTRGEILLARREKEMKDRMDKVILAMGSIEKRAGTAEKGIRRKNKQRAQGKRRDPKMRKQYKN